MKKRTTILTSKCIILLLMLVLTCSSFLTVAPVASAECGSWYMARVFQPYCYGNTCGIRIVQTNYQDVWWERSCVNDYGETYTETYTEYRKIGCC